MWCIVLYNTGILRNTEIYMVAISLIRFIAAACITITVEREPVLAK